MAYFTNYVCFYKLDENNTLLLNTLTSAIDVVDNSTINKIQKMVDGKELITPENNSELYDKLKKRGYIFESEDEENRILSTLKKISNRSTSEAFNTQFVICPTMGCNLRCTYCFENSNMHTDILILNYYLISN